MKTLTTYLFESTKNAITINEGGAAGHMAHPIDFGEFTCQDLIDLVNDLFSAKIEGITEKLDGTNIQATMNPMGQVMFIRNKTDLNSINGGMSLDDMIQKWSSNQRVRDNFVHAGEIITQVFNNIGKDWFNPDSQTRRIVNCECITAGKTNIMPYSKDQVDFHNIWIYKKGIVGWEQKVVTKDGLDVLSKACQNIDKAQITPQVTIRVVEKSKERMQFYTNQLINMFGNKKKTIEDWKHERFNEYMEKHYPELKMVDELFNRFFKEDKSINLKVLKQGNPEHEQDVDVLCKIGYKDAISTVVAPLDKLFIKLGNDIIKLCNGLTNQGIEANNAIQTLENDLKAVINDIQQSGTDDAKARLLHQFSRMYDDDSLKANETEGIVFSYKGKMMKLTGNFAIINSIINDSMRYSK